MKRVIDVVGVAIDIIYIVIKLLIVGLAFRLKIIRKSYLTVLKTLTENSLVVSIIVFIFGFIVYFFSDLKASNLPKFFLPTGFLIFLLLVILIRSLMSKEKIMKLATKQLGGEGDDPCMLAKRAIQENPSAAEMNRILAEGRKNPLAYDFLVRLWCPIIKRCPALSFLKIPEIPGVKPPKVKQPPILYINMDPPIPDDAISNEKLLNSLLQSNLESHYPPLKEYREEYQSENVKTMNENLINSKPYCRHLSRYKGPEPRDIGFRNDFDGYNACINSINFEDEKLTLPIKCSLEFYGNIIDSCEIMMEELFLHFAHHKRKTKLSPEQLLNFLPWRKALHKQHKENPLDILFQGKGTASAFGVSALTVFKRDNEFVAVYGLRSGKVGTSTHTYHVIPAGMTNFDPDKDDDINHLTNEKCLNIKLLIEKEFLEECFDEKKLCGKYNVHADKWPSVVKRAATEHLYGDKDNKYNANIYFTGIVFDLLNYRPEICALILIENEQWWADHTPNNPDNNITWKPSYEWDNINNKDQLNVARLQPPCPIRIDQKIDFLAKMPPEKSVPCGFAAFYLGVQKARKLLNINIKE